MSRWTPCKRRSFIERLRRLGFDGPYSGARHELMLFQNHRLSIPSNSEYSVPQLRFMLNEVERIIEREITVDEWNEL